MALSVVRRFLRDAITTGNSSAPLGDDAKIEESIIPSAPQLPVRIRADVLGRILLLLVVESQRDHLVPCLPPREDLSELDHGHVVPNNIHVVIDGVGGRSDDLHYVLLERKDLEPVVAQ